MMNLLVDSRWAGSTGIGRVYQELISRIPTSISPSFVQKAFSLGHPLSPYYLANEISSKKGIDAFYSPSYMPPLYSKVPFVVTIHDLNHLYFYSVFHKLYLKYFLASLAKNASMIITVSEFSKSEIISKLGIKENKIKVIYNAVEQSFTNNVESYELGFQYFLYVGNRRSYKNLKLMINAFSKAKIPSTYKLLITGEIDDELGAIIDSLSMKERVLFLGYIHEGELPKLYKGAFALLFISLMEGFGLPILEAMASGVPVITSNTSALVEIAGNAALLVDPLSIHEVSSAIEQLVNSTDLQNSLVNKGLLRIKDFSWDKSASETWEILVNL